MEIRLKAEGYETDKGSNYLERYDEYFHHLIESEISLLELGIYKGGSLLMWRDYFKKGTIVGLDIEPVKIKDSIDRVYIYQGLQQDKKILDRIRIETAKDGFDIIIDDASHIGELTSISFWYLFDNHLKPGGIYVIEDWGSGYWGKWPDGKQYNLKRNDFHKGIRNYIDLLIDRTVSNSKDKKDKVIVRKVLKRIRNKISKHRLKSHEYGMVGFIKQLIDELGMEDIIKGSERGSKMLFRESKFLKMEIFPGQVFILKNPNERVQKV